MEAMKFRVHNEEHSKAIQKRLFELGYSWSSYGKTLKFLAQTYLFASDDYTVTYAASHDYFEEDDRKETTLDELYSLKKDKTVKLNSKLTATILEKERVVKVGRQKFTFEKIEELHKAISTL